MLACEERLNNLSAADILIERGSRITSGGAKGKASLAEISLLMAVFFVGTDVVSVKYALEGFPPLVLMPFRYVLAGLLLLAVCRCWAGRALSGPAAGTSSPWRASGWWAFRSTTSATRWA